MPTFAHQTQRRMSSEAYQELIQYFNVNRSPEILELELLVRAEILKRDFTKRQVNIILMIFTFSYPYGKSSAIIPQQKDWELCGVSKTLIKKEIQKLVDLDVITYNKDEEEYSINSPLIWSAPYHHGYSDERSKELFLINIKHAGINSGLSLEDIMDK
jgi:hypothetical protein